MTSSNQREGAMSPFCGDWEWDKKGVTTLDVVYMLFFFFSQAILPLTKKFNKNENYNEVEKHW